jgi:geranylgeranyl diphosphate synthase type I
VAEAETVEPLELPDACHALARRVNAELERFVGEQRAEIGGRAPGIGELFDELDRVVRAGGKRLRPIFCCLGHRATGAEVDDRCIRAAAALELLHTFAIIHDDVMDKSSTRRGELASWVHLEATHRKASWIGDPAGYGLAAAILAGDMALVLADRALLRSGFPEDRLAPALARYDRMRVEVVAGQYLDVLAAHRGGVEEDEARRIAVLKSGGYTVEAPLQIGAILAGAGAPLLEVLGRYGVALGEAFQLRDDVLGVFGDPAVTGKDRDSDLREGKRTVLLAKASAAAAGPDRELLAERLGRPDVSDDELDRARALLRSTGALDDTVALIDERVDAARSALDAAPLPREVRSVLDEVARAVAVGRPRAGRDD